MHCLLSSGGLVLTGTSLVLQLPKQTFLTHAKRLEEGSGTQAFGGGAKDIPPSPPNQSPGAARRDGFHLCLPPDGPPSDFLHIYDDSHVSFSASWFTKCFYLILLAHHNSLRVRLWRGPLEDVICFVTY